MMVMITITVAAFLFDHLLCAQHASRCFIGIVPNPHDIPAVGGIVPILQIRKLRLSCPSSLNWDGVFCSLPGDF